MIIAGVVFTFSGMATKRNASPPDQRWADTYPDDRLLTLAEAAEVMSLSYWTLSRMCTRGEFVPEAFKLPGGQWRVRYGDLKNWLTSMRPPAVHG